MLLRGNATEARLRSLNLSEYSVLVFATHGLSTGDETDLLEPALLLSPGDTGPRNDGLLTVTEVADLKLAANWVLLLACNTAALLGSGATQLAQLQRFAG